MAKKRKAGETVVIKKYANRRLYDTSTSSYVTLDHLSSLVRDGVDFVVQDAKTGDDLTRSVLTQIIFEQENKGSKNVLPLGFLREIIKFYGDNFQSVLPAYLEMSMSEFTKNQHRWRDAMAKTMGGNPMALFEEQTRRNMDMFEKSLTMFGAGNLMPTGRSRSGKVNGDDATADRSSANGDASQPASTEDMITLLQEQMMEMQRQLWELSRKDTDR